MKHALINKMVKSTASIKASGWDIGGWHADMTDGAMSQTGIT